VFGSVRIVNAPIASHHESFTVSTRFTSVRLSERHVTQQQQRDPFTFLLMGFWSVLAGAVTSHCILGPESLLPNMLFTVKPRTRVSLQELFPLGHSCAVCGKVKCKRHRPTLLLENYQPWLDLKVHSKVDASIAEVPQLTFRTGSLRPSAPLHPPSAPPAGVRVVNGVEGLEQAALELYGADLHVALRSRKHELLYLRKVTEMLFPFVMPPKATDCRSLALLMREVMAGSVILPTMDFMADPVSDHMFLPPSFSTEPPSALVPFLQKYAGICNKKPSVLKLELKEIREEQDLLFRFMNFLKQEGAVHVLQFCLAVEEFNDKILRPELSDSELQRLHGEVVHIYQTYCLDESIDKISFDPFIVEEIKNIADGPYGGVVKLQTMTCLFEAYEHVLSLLEKVFTPMFCHSDEVRPENHLTSLSKNFSKRGESFGISRIGSKIKGVFKSTTMEGALLPPSAMSDLDDDTVEEATMVMEDDPVPAAAAAAAAAELAGVPGSQRNLLAWSITIPYIDLCEDEVKKERVPVFCIDVVRNDRKEAVGHETEKWSVFRRYLEFYVLDSKLTEFHGTFADAQLPSKRIIGPKNYEFLSSKREEFEEYLQRLLQHPELRNSQLLADFLSPHSMESQFLERMLPDVNLGKIFKSVPGKLMKEKGQNLDPFIQSFFNSCESPKPKPSRPELTILSPSAENNKKLFNDLFRDNAGEPEGPGRRRDQADVMKVDGMYDYMMYVGHVVFHVSDWLHHMLVAGRILFKSTFEAYMDQYMQSKLDQILQEHRVVSLITQLRDAIFCENSEERTAEAKQTRAKQTFEEMMKYLPDFVGRCIGEDAKYEGIQLLFEALQQPLLNKQVERSS
uniref:Sorting nexin-14-like n=1 Tax=Salarias fasciatus TaxID=181472 RepID=A0A672H074_SALFA